jgi:hypothetical protein
MLLLSPSTFLGASDRRLNAPTPLHVQTYNDWALMNARIRNADTMVIRVNEMLLPQDFRTGSGLSTGNILDIPCRTSPPFALVLLSGPSTFLGLGDGLTRERPE